MSFRGVLGEFEVVSAQRAWHLVARYGTVVGYLKKPLLDLFDLTNLCSIP